MIREGYWGDSVVFDPAAVVDLQHLKNIINFRLGILPRVDQWEKLLYLTGKILGEKAGQVIRRWAMKR